MREGWEVLRFSDVLSLDLAREKVEDGREFPIVGVLGFGRGLLHREPVTRATTSYRELTRVRPGQLIYSKLKAFEGAITVAPNDLDEQYASGEFPTFTPTGRALPEFLRLLTQRHELWQAMTTLSKGMGGRRERLNPNDFLGLAWNFPPVVEQQRIVDLIGAVDDAIDAAGAHGRALESALAARRDLAFSVPETRPASEMFDILIGLQRSPARATGPNQTRYLRSANVTKDTLLLDDVLSMSFDDKQRAKYQLEPGDVLVSEGSASANAVGSSAVYRGELEAPLGFQNTLLRFRAIDGVTTPDFTAHWCAWAYESGAFREAASGTNILHIGSGGASLMGVAAVPFDEQSALTAELQAAAETLALARKASSALRTLRSNLLTALLSGEHEIPESYDEMMEEVA